MGVYRSFVSVSRWAKLILVQVLIGTALHLVGFSSLNWAVGNAVETRDHRKNVLYSKNLSDTYIIAANTGLWEFCTKLEFKMLAEPPMYYNDLLRKSVSSCRRLPREFGWMLGVQATQSFAIVVSITTSLLIILYIFLPNRCRDEKVAMAQGVSSLVTGLLILCGTLVYGIKLKVSGIELSQFDCYYLDRFVFAASDLSWSFLVSCLAGVFFFAGSFMSYFLAKRTMQKERMRRRSEAKDSYHAPRLLQQTSQTSDSVFN